MQFAWHRLSAKRYAQTEIRKRLLFCGLASGSIYVCVVANLNWRQITNCSNISLARRRNDPRELNDGCYDYGVMSINLLTVTRRQTLRMWMNQNKSKGFRSEKEYTFRFVATEANPVALRTREIETRNLTQSCRAFGRTLRPETGPKVSLT